MNKDTQIKEMAKLMHLNYDMPYEFAKGLTEFLIDEGWRKASEVAREIFECLLNDITRELEIARSIRKKYFHNIEKNNIWVYHYDGEIKALEDMECLIAELKKKYTEGANESHIS
jgi:hypothetical protein